jgi:hypothetical protein
VRRVDKEKTVAARRRSGAIKAKRWRGTAWAALEFLIRTGRNIAMLGTVLIIVLLLLLLGAWPSWPYSAGWGYYPSGILGLVLVVVLVLVLIGRV